MSTRFRSRVLPFDRAAAQFYATLAVELKQKGRFVGMADLQIAAIARARGAAAIVTRNIDDFVDCGVPLINPWQAAWRFSFEPVAARNSSRRKPVYVWRCWPHYRQSPSPGIGQWCGRIR